MRPSFDERIARLKAKAAREERPRVTRYPGPHKPHPRSQHVQRAARSWVPVFPFPVRSTWHLIERYAIYFGG